VEKEKKKKKREMPVTGSNQPFCFPCQSNSTSFFQNLKTTHFTDPNKEPKSGEKKQTWHWVLDFDFFSIFIPSV